MFRPARRVTAPDGTRWEIYAYKIRRPQPGAGRGLRRLAGRLRSVVTVTVASLRGDEWTIEAISFVPPETYTWRTTREHKGQVLANLEGGLARGDVPGRLPNATFLGAT